MRSRVVVVGAGIAGLACAHELLGRGRDVVVLEASDRVGGAIASETRDGFVLEAGPTTLRPTPALREIVAETGLEDRVLEAPAGLARYVFAGGRLERVPSGPGSFATTSLLSLRGKLRLLGEPFVPRRRGGDDESIEGFVARRFGREVHDRLVAPLVSGIFAGNPDALSAGAAFPSLVALEERHGTVIGGALRGALTQRGGGGSRRVVSFRDGLGELPGRLAERLGDRVRLGQSVASLERSDDGIFAIATGAGETVEADAVVITVREDAAASLVGRLRPEAAAELRSIEAAPLAIVHLAVDRSAVRSALDGFGFLVAPGESLRILGCLWSSSVFPSHAPPGRASLTVFAGGATDPDAARLPDEALLAEVTRDLDRSIGLAGEPECLGVDRYERAIPQYALGHRDRIRRIESALADLPGLVLAGNYTDGVGVGDCIARGRAAAERSCRS